MGKNCLFSDHSEHSLCEMYSKVRKNYAKWFVMSKILLNSKVINVIFPRSYETILRGQKSCRSSLKMNKRVAASADLQFPVA